MSTATANGDAGVKAAAAAVATKQQKSLDSARKPSASPADSQSKKQTSLPPKAWQGPNPITQRASLSPAVSNGSEKTLPKLPAQSHSPSQLQSQSQLQQRTYSPSQVDRHAHERLLYLLAHCTGADATLTLKSGEQFTGLYSGTSIDSPAKATYTLKMARRIRLASHQQVNGTADTAEQYIGEGEEHIMNFEIQDTADLAVSNVVTASAHATQNGSAGSSFRTDTEISRRDPQAPRQRELQRWDGGDDMSLDDMALDTSGGTTWDQFAVNERNFGTQSTYNEDEYTTSIDRSHPEYKRRAAQAERLAREIEGSAPANAHVAEERRQNAERGDGQDEEDKYSGVARATSQLPTGGAGSYVPPSRRPITSQPTVQGAPFDPAIVSLTKPTPSPAVQPVAQPAAPPATASQEPAEPQKAAEPVAKPEEIKLTPPPTTNKDQPVSTMPSVRKPETRTEDHVRDTADAFKQFANNEKLKIRAAQEQKRSNARHEKNVKLNDLKKFAENFKLKSRVPDDLVPILAKDHEKQLEIQRKAEESARDEELRAKERDKAKATSTPPKPSASQTPSSAVSGDARAQFQQQPRNRSSQNVRGMPTISSPRGGPLSHRQNLPFMNQRMQGVPPPPQPLSTDVRIPTGPMSSRESGTLSPASATNARLNVNAKEFKFHPTISNFTPSGSSPSPQRVSGGPAAPQPVASFFDGKDGKKSGSAKMDVNTACDTVKYLKAQEYPAEKQKKLAQNGGVPPPFDTPPTWTDPSEHIPASYDLAFPKPQIHSQGPSPLHTPNPAGGPMPHAHQLPPHLQAPHLPTPVQPQRYYGPPPHGGAQHAHAQSFDPRMHFPNNHGPGASVPNSPRYAPAQMAAYNGQMGMGLPQMPQFAGQPMQGYGMSPSMAQRQMNVPMPMPQGGGMMMMPGQPSPYMNQMRPGFPSGPSFGPNMPPQMGGQMMMQTPSSNGYPPPPQHYSPMPPHAQPHMPHLPPGGPGGPNGYAASPRPGPHMMQHSGSHQGFAHMGPQGGQGQGQGQGQFFNGSPAHAGAQAAFPHQFAQRHPSSGFVQMTPRAGQALPVQAQNQSQSGQHAPSPGMAGQTQGQAGQAQAQGQAQGQAQAQAQAQAQGQNAGDEGK